MIPAIIFSKDRPMQLDALLSSLEANWPYKEIAVLWKASDVEYEDGYGICAQLHPNVRWVGERTFAHDVALLLRLESICGSERVVFFVDDDILYESVPETPLSELSEWRDVFAFSLRLGLNTHYCYPLDQYGSLRNVAPLSVGIMWAWEREQGDYSYPASLDGHIMRLENVREMLSGESPKNPYELEVILSAKVQQYRHAHPMLASYGHSRLVGIPHNSVIGGDQPKNRCGNGSAVELLERFFDGQRIDWKKMNFKNIHSAHMEVPYVFTDAV